MSSILQWNSRGLISKWSEMRKFFTVLAPVLIAIQGTCSYQQIPKASILSIIRYTVTTKYLESADMEVSRCT